MYEPFSRGVIAGIAGVIAINLVELLGKVIGLSKTSLSQGAGLVFLSQEAVKTPLGIILGFTSQICVTIFVAIVISFFIYFIGIGWSLVKGAAISLLFMYVFLGWAIPMRKIMIPNAPNDVLMGFIVHIVAGAVIAYAVKYLHNRN